MGRPKKKPSNIECYNDNIWHPNAGKRKISKGIKRRRIEKENEQPQQAPLPNQDVQPPSAEPTSPSPSAPSSPLLPPLELSQDFEILSHASPASFEQQFLPPDTRNFPSQCSLERYCELKKQLLETGSLPSLESLSGLQPFTPAPYSPHSSISSLSGSPSLLRSLAISRTEPSTPQRPATANKPSPFKAPPPPAEELRLDDPEIWNFSSSDLQTAATFPVSFSPQFPCVVFARPADNSDGTADDTASSDSEWEDPGDDSCSSSDDDSDDISDEDGDLGELEPEELVRLYMEESMDLEALTAGPSNPSTSTPSLLTPTLSPSASTPAPISPDPDHYERYRPPSIKAIWAASERLRSILRPKKKNGRGYKDPGINPFLRTRLELMLSTMTSYSSPKCVDTYGKWMHSSLSVAYIAQKSTKTAMNLRAWIKAFIADPTVLPTPKYKGRHSVIENEELAGDIALHLQSIGKYIAAKDVVDYVARPDVRQKYGLKKRKEWDISVKTAEIWMKRMGYRWTRTPKGQYVDGHERSDVVYYRQNDYLPAVTDLEHRTRAWILTHLHELGQLPRNRIVVIWFHDESTFYAHDRRDKVWVHASEKAVPKPKGEGASLMIAEFVSADYGYLVSKDGTKSARVVFEAGKARDGYFTNDDILKQVEDAMDILAKDYPDEEHVIVFDNATTHRKREDDALSARHMPKMPSKMDGPNWGVSKNEVDASGNVIYEKRMVKSRKKKGKAEEGDGQAAAKKRGRKRKAPEGEGEDQQPAPRPQEGELKNMPKKVWMRMRDTIIPATGQTQSLYFPDDHPKFPGRFKGMAAILTERGYHEEAKLRAECPEFKCPPKAKRCCCRRFLYDQPDFRNEKSILEKTCEKRGFKVLFLPKFHPELNFIEQVWGASKKTYRMFPLSSSVEDLRNNVLAALDSVDLKMMRRFARRAWKFVDAYRRGLNGSQAAWAAKKYRGHRRLPDQILEEFEKYYPQR